MNVSNKIASVTKIDTVAFSNWLTITSRFIELKSERRKVEIIDINKRAKNKK